MSLFWVTHSKSKHFIIWWAERDNKLKIIGWWGVSDKWLNMNNYSYHLGKLQITQLTIFGVLGVSLFWKMLFKFSGRILWKVLFNTVKYVKPQHVTFNELQLPAHFYTQSWKIFQLCSQSSDIWKIKKKIWWLSYTHQPLRSVLHFWLWLIL